MDDLVWYMNPVIHAVVAAWMGAQFIKFMTALVRFRKIDFYYFVSTGGMPSAHSASVSALAAAVGLREGFGTTLFGVAFTFALIVMFDAQSVRRAAGHQARLLNQIVEEVFKDHQWPHAKLAELLGHSRPEVFAGMLLGVGVSVFVLGG